MQTIEGVVQCYEQYRNRSESSVAECAGYTDSKARHHVS